MKHTIITLVMLTCCIIGVDSEARMHIEKNDYNRLWKEAFQSVQPSPPEVPYRKIFEQAALKYNLPVTLLMAVARGESSFSPVARSSANCVGVMQLAWPTAREMGMHRKSQLTDPEKNIFTGAKYLRYLFDMHGGNIHRSLCAYNYGPSVIHAKLPNKSIPAGANWYSGYIWYHYTRLQKNAGYDPNVAGYLPLIVFENPARAKVIITYLKRVEGLRLDCIRMDEERFTVALVYNNNVEKQSALHKLRCYGIDTYNK